MKTLLTLLVILTLLSCDKKVTIEDTQPITGQLESTLAGKDSTSDNRLLGEWTVQLSCDGSIMCNQCRKISFRTDGFVTIANSVRTFEIMKWEIENDRLKIKNIASDNIVDNGEYEMKYTTSKDITELELVDVKTSDCYKFTR